MIRLLQLSDIHWKDKLNDVDPFKHIREGLIEDIKRGIRQEEITYNSILICGDIAFSGGEKEYEKATIFLKDLLDETGLTKEDVFVVPGNHDKNWFAHPQKFREFINSHICEDKEHDEVLANWLQTDMHSASMMFTPYKEYDKFANEFGCSEMLMNRMNSETLGINAAYTDGDDKMYWEDELAKIGDYTIKIYGLNSGLYSDKYDYDDTEERKDGHKMLLPKLAYNAAKRQDGVVNIMMVHHPMPYIHEGDNLKMELDKLYDVQFYGHVHIANSDNENNCIHVFSGALQPDEMNMGKNYRPVYNIVELDIDNSNGDDYLTMNLQERYWNGSTFTEYRTAQHYSVKLPKYQWKGVNMIQTTNLPDGVTKHVVRVRLINNGKARQIIETLSPGFYDESVPKYYNVMRFLEKVRQEGLWNKLWTEMEK
ncbi:MAG: metallophosphoesterase [Prevotella sp.]|nr:metallophosphoesterase [Prevotella sp.]